MTDYRYEVREYACRRAQGTKRGQKPIKIDGETEVENLKTSIPVVLPCLLALSSYGPVFGRVGDPRGSGLWRGVKGSSCRMKVL